MHWLLSYFLGISWLAEDGAAHLRRAVLCQLWRPLCLRVQLDLLWRAQEGRCTDGTRYRWRRGKSKPAVLLKFARTLRLFQVVYSFIAVTAFAAVMSLCMLAWNAFLAIKAHRSRRYEALHTADYTLETWLTPYQRRQRCSPRDFGHGD